jgi:hypothetical protein
MSAKPPRASPPKQQRPPEADFWRAKSLEELAAQQGVRPVKWLEEVLGQGADLWTDDADLDAFLRALRERRRRGG